VTVTSDNPSDKISRWGKRIQECLALADAMKSEESRRSLNAVAAAYKKMIERELRNIEALSKSAP
jgi:hypothetical protein